MKGMCEAEVDFVRGEIGGSMESAGAQISADGKGKLSYFSIKSADEVVLHGHFDRVSLEEVLSRMAAMEGR